MEYSELGTRELQNSFEASYRFASLQKERIVFKNSSLANLMAYDYFRLKCILILIASSRHTSQRPR